MSRFINLLASSTAIACVTLAANGGVRFNVYWHTIDGGGQTYATGGGFTLGGTLGQPDAGPLMVGGGFIVAGGFWPTTSTVVCPADLDGNGTVDAADLAILLGQWNGPGSGDFNGSGTVDAADLGTLLGEWGPCPG